MVSFNSKDIKLQILFNYSVSYNLILGIKIIDTVDFETWFRSCNSSLSSFQFNIKIRVLCRVLCVCTQACMTKLEFSSSWNILYKIQFQVEFHQPRLVLCVYVCLCRVACVLCWNTWIMIHDAGSSVDSNNQAAMLILFQ